MKNEGCLSLPGVVEMVERYPTVMVTYYDADGKRQVEKFEGIEAQCIQHEVEHLDGVIIPDKLGPAARETLAARMAKGRKKRSREPSR
jgi:peptide deformylase